MTRGQLAGSAVAALLAFTPCAWAQMGGGGMGGMGGGGGHGHGHGHGQQGDQAPHATSPQPRPGDPVNFCGKVVALVQDGCVGIVGQTSTVEMSAITPKPEPGTVITGTGIVGDQANICMQGLHLQSASWKVAHSCSDD